MLGTPLMPWQRHVLDVALEHDDDGRLVYRQVVLTVPRQAGKTTALLSLLAWRATKWPDQRLIYTAQSRNDAYLQFTDNHVPTLERSTLGRMFTVRRSNGSESIRWANGSTHTIAATHETAVHGRQLDLGVLDEAFHLVDNRMEQAFKPAMVTRHHPQLWIVSTAGTADSTYLRQKVDRGREDVARGLTSSACFFEWSAADDLDPANPATWVSCHPALGHTIDLDVIRGDFESMELAEFERAYLNRWTHGVTSSPIPVSTWNRREDADAAPGDDVCFAVDFAPDREHASIAAAGTVGDGRHVIELVDRRAGTDWVVGRIIQLWDRWSPRAVVIDQVGPAATVIPELEAAGINVVTTSSRDMAQACGRLFDAVLNDKVRHRGQPELTAAVSGAAKRRLGDAWAFSRSSSAVDISPLVAATLALWGVTTVERADDEVPPDPVLAVW
jgi:phage terminase large subunit-like protein